MKIVSIIIRIDSPLRQSKVDIKDNRNEIKVKQMESENKL
jgi:hypothetical protein